MTRRKKIVVHPLTKRVGSLVGSSFLEGMHSYEGCSLVIYLFVVVNEAPSVLYSFGFCQLAIVGPEFFAILPY